MRHTRIFLAFAIGICAAGLAAQPGLPHVRNLRGIDGNQHTVLMVQVETRSA
jgi:hypothetical protein